MHYLLLPIFIFASISSFAKNQVVTIKTTKGTIEVELNKEKSPKTVENFLSYVKKKHYNGTIFHRVINNFMIQGGGYTADLKEKDTDKPIKNEADNGLKNEKYTIAMARTNDPHSASAQFYINVVDNPGLDFKEKNERGWGYTVFGKVKSGTDIVDKIKEVPTTSKPDSKGMMMEDVPKDSITIESIELKK